MKRTYAIFISLILVIVGITVISWQRKNVTMQAPETQETSAVVSVSIDDGEHIATTSGVTANNPFDALMTVAKKNDVQVTTKQYDFGQFVQAIGLKQSSDTQAWIYFVNGVSGTIAADKYLLHTGDRVDWKYSVPQW